MSVSSSHGRNTSARDRILVVLAVIAFAIAGAVVWKTISAQQPHEVGRLNLGVGTSPKAEWVKAHRGGQTAGPTTEPSGAPAGQ